jgi:hypothetical protein
MIIELDNYVNAEDLAYIREQIEPRITGYGEPNEYHRAGTTLTIAKISELTDLNSRLSNIFRNVKVRIRRDYRPSYSGMGDSGYEFHRYQPGDICKPHGDSEIVAGEPHLRYASVVLHLNTVETGGELIFPTQDIRVKTKAGKIVVFPPYGMFNHYTTPSEEVRDVIVTWFTYDGLSVVKNGINITSNQGLLNGIHN